jgi:hypothetical protein
MKNSTKQASLGCRKSGRARLDTTGSKSDPASAFAAKLGLAGLFISDARPEIKAWRIMAPQG